MFVHDTHDTCSRVWPVPRCRAVLCPLQRAPSPFAIGSAVTPCGRGCRSCYRAVWPLLTEAEAERQGLWLDAALTPELASLVDEWVSQVEGLPRATVLHVAVHRNRGKCVHPLVARRQAATDARPRLTMHRAGGWTATWHGGCAVVLPVSCDTVDCLGAARYVLRCESTNFSRTVWGAPQGGYGGGQRRHM